MKKIIDPILRDKELEEAREELALSLQLLNSILDKDVEGLSEDEAKTIKETRASRMLRAARRVEAAVRGERLTLRGITNDE